MRTCVCALVLTGLLVLTSCAPINGGDLSGLFNSTCAVYDGNSDGTVTTQEVMDGFEQFTGFSIGQADAQDYIDQFCSGGDYQSSGS